MVPGDGSSDVFIGSNKLTFTNDAINAMFRDTGVELLSIEEPQIAGVSDEDIKDDTKPVAFEEVVDENDIERDVDKVVEDTSDLVVEAE